MQTCLQVSTEGCSFSPESLSRPGRARWGCCPGWTILTGSSRKVLPPDVPPGERRWTSCVLLCKKIGKVNKECEKGIRNQKSGTRIFPWKERMDLLKFNVIKFMASGWSSVWKVKDNFPAVLSSSGSFSFFSAPCFISFVEKALWWFVHNQWCLRMHTEDLWHSTVQRHALNNN